MHTPLKLLVVPNLLGTVMAELQKMASSIKSSDLVFAPSNSIRKCFSDQDSPEH